ncbi:PREDICTED: SLC2A4 regulator, partial [Aptenodytes forsteri]|uniref:SLC2A4 regulator n=1 Tax=Aptenodytes forsteri TaxID=9233 RepID=UPI0004F40E6F
MAATVLTSLSTSPLVLGHPPEGGARHVLQLAQQQQHQRGLELGPPQRPLHPPPPPPRRLQPVPSTFLPAPLPDEGPDEPDGTHFVFGEPIPRKRKNSTKVMFKCLWKSCGKVLSSSSGMQKHIRTVHLGRKADLEQSD